MSTIDNALAILDLNPQRLEDVETTLESTVVSSGSFVGRFSGFVKWAARIVHHPLSGRNASQVLQDTCSEVQGALNQLLDETPPRFLNSFRDRISFINRWRPILSIESLNKLRSIFGRFQLSISQLDSDNINRIVSIKAMVDIETALRISFPLKCLRDLSEGKTPSEEQKIELQNWFSLFQSECGFITPTTLLHALQGALMTCGAYSLSSISTLCWRLKSIGYVAFNRIDRRAELALINFQIGHVVAGKHAYKITHRQQMDCFGEYGIEVHSTTSGICLLTSDNPFKLLTWLGALTQCVHIATPIKVVDVDSNFQWLAIEQFDCTLQKAIWHKPFPCRVHGLDLDLLGNLSLLVQFCVQNRISMLPPLQTLVVVNKNLKTLVPNKIDPEPFSLAKLAHWVYEAVQKDTIRYREVMYQARIDLHAHYKFFSAVVHRVLFEKDTRSIVEIGDTYAIDSKDVRLQAEEYALAIHKFKLLYLRHLQGRENAIRPAQTIAAFLEDRHLLFFVDDRWVAEITR